MRKILISLLIAALLIGAVCPSAFAADTDVGKLEDAIKVVTDAVSEARQILPEQTTVNTVNAIFTEFLSVARNTGTVLSVVNGSVSFLKLIGVVKDSNAEALANIQTQLKIINEQLEETERQLNNITKQMTQIQASVEFNARTEKAIMLRSNWNDFEHRYVETGMESLMTQYNGMLLNGMQNWCQNRTSDARTKDGIDNSGIILHYVRTDGEYVLSYSAKNESVSEFDSEDRYLVLSSDFMPSSISWDVNSYRTAIADHIAGKIREYSEQGDYDAFECGNFSAFTEAGSDGLTDELIRQVTEDAINVLIYRATAAEVNKDSTFSLEVERQFNNYCQHLLAPEEGMDAVFSAFYLTHAFEYQIADALTLFCNEMAIKTGVYGSFAVNVLGMSSFVTEKQKEDMLDGYCNTLIAIGQAKDNCLKGSDVYCYVTNTELYLGDIRFTNRISVNTSERTSTKAYKSFSASATEVYYDGGWRGSAEPSLIGDSRALLLTYMLQSNGESVEFSNLQKMLGSRSENLGSIVTSINSERSLPLNSGVSMNVTNVLGSYFRNRETARLQNLPGGAESEYINFRTMISGSILDASGDLEVNKVLDAAAVYGENHWFWEQDEAAVLGGAECPHRYLRSVNKVQTGLDFPGTYYYRTDYTHYIDYNCLVCVSANKGFSRNQYSPLDSYARLCKELEKNNNGGVISPAENDSGFVDVPDSAYYYDAVLWAAENGITEGTDAAHFSPDNVCTRAQMVTFLWRAADEPAPKESSCDFTDVDLNDYYGQALLWAVENGITKGTTETTFEPDTIVSRAQTVTFLHRFANCESASASLPFADVDENAFYYDAVTWAYANNIAKGTADTAFSPNADCTRAQTVTFLKRFMDR